MAARSRDDDDVEHAYGDDPRTFPHEGRGEDIDPAADEREWVDQDSDQLLRATELDDPVEGIELAALGANSEADARSDATELADEAVPPPPEETAFVARTGVAPTAEFLTVGLPPGIDLDGSTVEELSLDDLIEAEMLATDEGDGVMAVILAEEVRRRSHPQL